MSKELREVVDAYRASLPPGELHLFRVDGLDRLGVPVATAAFFPERGKACEGFGYGLSETEALVGAMGELVEEVRADRWLAEAPRERGTFADLRRRFGETGAIDPLTLCLPAGSAYDADTTELTWVKVTRHPDGAQAWAPIDAVASDEAHVGYKPELFVPITNGLGAGLDLDRCLMHGLLELHQRDGNVLSYRALDRGVVVDLDGLDDPELRGLVDKLRSSGIDVTAKLACTDFSMPNLYVVGFDEAPEGFALQVTACGEAVHPVPAVALRKAMAEFVSSRSRKTMRHGEVERLRGVAPREFLRARFEAADPDHEEQRGLNAMIDWVGRGREELRALLANSAFSKRETVRFEDLPGVAPEQADDPAKTLNLLTERMAEQGLAVWYADFFDPASRVRAAKVLAPGLECETMSYHRIGERGVARMRERGGMFLVDGPGEGRARVRLTEAAEERLGGPAWLDVASIDRTVGELYPLYREPAGQAVRKALAQRAGKRIEV